VATGPGSENEVIRDEAINLGFDCPYTYRPEDDVLARFYDAAVLYRGDTIVRITGDCPLVNPWVVDEVISSLGDNDFATNVLRRTFPMGLAVEVIPFKTLWGLQQLLSPDHPDREHVCSYIYKVPHMFDIASVEDDEEHPELRWCVDHEEDIEDVERILGYGLIPYHDVMRREDGQTDDDVSWTGGPTRGAGEADADDGGDEGYETADEQY